MVDLITYSFNNLKDKVRASTQKHQQDLDDAAHCVNKAIAERQLRQLRKSSRMGHGWRH